MAIRIIDAIGATNFQTEPIAGVYAPNSIDIRIPAGQAYYQIGRDTGTPYNSANDIISFFRSDGSFICGGPAQAFANAAFVPFATTSDIESYLQPFFFDLGTTPPFVEAAPPNMLFVSPLGNDANPGTMQSPKLNINSALTSVAANGEVVCLPGTYDQYITGVNGKVLRLEPGANFTFTMANDRHWFSDNGDNIIFSIIGSKGTNRITVTAATPQPIGNGINVSGNSQLNIRGVDVTFTSNNLQAPLMRIAGASVNVTLEECHLNVQAGSSHCVQFTSTSAGSITRFNESVLQNSASLAVMMVGGGHSPQMRGTRLFKLFGTFCIDSPTTGQGFDCYGCFANRDRNTANITVRVAPSLFINNTLVRP